jgi:hypothetical protein
VRHAKNEKSWTNKLNFQKLLSSLFERLIHY